MDEYTKARIKDFSNKIKEKMKGGNLFGIPIDENDTDSLVCAAYLIGELEGKSLRREDFLGFRSV